MPKSTCTSIVAVFCLLTGIATAGLPESVVDTINQEFATEVWGTDRDFWNLIASLYPKNGSNTNDGIR
jgi:hypothetical protein